jgi:6-pyruvoyltetrahydropterin/6-carboxytetrahydropterin synthase
MIVTKEIQLDYGHTLPNHYGFCSEIHGHRAKVIATIEGDFITKSGSSSEGMVMDFKFIKEAMMKHIHDKLDHGFAVWKEDEEDYEFIVKRNARYLITDHPPTAECLAKWAYDQIVGIIEKEGCKLVCIEWFETPTSSACYAPGR